MKFRLFSVIAVFAAFTIYTAIVITNHGVSGLIDVLGQGGWAGQIFVDLCIALGLFIMWMVSDARERGIPALPYAIAILGTGSIGALAYLVHRTVKEAGQQPARTAVAS